MIYVMVARWQPREDAAEKIEAILGELAKAIRKGADIFNSRWRSLFC